MLNYKTTYSFSVHTDEIKIYDEVSVHVEYHPFDEVFFIEYKEFENSYHSHITDMKLKKFIVGNKSFSDTINEIEIYIDKLVNHHGTNKIELTSSFSIKDGLDFDINSYDGITTKDYFFMQSRITWIE